MQRKRKEPRPKRALPVLEKTPTGIDGFDQITGGGLPKGRPSLICGGAGCGKTLFGMHFLVRGAQLYDEPGVFLAFEEREKDLFENVASLGFDLEDLVKNKRIALDHVQIERNEIEETGEYDLEALFLRLESAIDSVGAKRVVIDTLETLFGGLSNYAILRSELRRLFSWLKEKGVTTIVTAERGDGTLTRHGLEEYVSDCVVVLDHRVQEQVSTRRIRVVKYRGSTHGTNEYPFLIDATGITVVPITSVELNYDVSDEHVSTGIPKLDSMLGGGFYRGSTVLISGTAGCGKTSLCSHLVDATCAAGERALYVSYEESPEQILRNMQSIGLGLRRWVKEGLLEIDSLRSTSYGLEAHLGLIHKKVEGFEPSIVVLDPVGTLTDAGNTGDAHLMASRLIDFLKYRGVTAVLSNLTSGHESIESTAIAISSLVDVWLLVRAIESNGERNRGLYVLKSRGMAHSNQIREFQITSHGIQLLEPYIGPEGVLTGTARIAQENREVQAERQRQAETDRLRQVIDRKRALLEQQIENMKQEFESEVSELTRQLGTFNDIETMLVAQKVQMGELRGALRTHKGKKAESNGKRLNANP